MYEMKIFLLCLLAIGIINPFLRWVRYYRYLKRTVHFREILKKLSTMEEDVSKNLKLTLASPGSPRDNQYYIQIKCQEMYSDKYESLRKEVAENIPAIRLIASQIGISTVRLSYPAPVVGGPISEVCIFGSVLEDLGYVETRWHTRFDALDKMIGILKDTRFSSFIQIFNPIAWLTTILRVPFFLLKATGFNVDKIEDSVWGHLFKLLFFIGLIVGLLKLGFTAEQISKIHFP